MQAIENTAQDQILETLASQRAFFRSGATLDIGFRKDSLRALLSALEKWEDALCDALWTDLHKCRQEAYLTEIGILKAEIRHHIRHVSRWARTERKCTPMSIWPSSSHIVKDPLGCALIVSPWNYPVQLLLNPLIGAISAGCTAVLKPSPYVPNVSQALEAMIAETFDPQYVALVQGNRDVNTFLLEQRWDIIFFTGSPALGRTVMSAAAKNLTPVVLELGGKSPCIVAADADVRMAARRMAWGKVLNAGQTCIAPDYALVHESVRDAFVAEFHAQVKSLLGENPKESEYYVRMVRDAAFERVSSYVVENVEMDASERYIEPSVVLDPDPDSPVMTTEIFGPVLPVLSVKSVDEAVDFILGREKPLALYYFGNKADGMDVMRRTSSGGACINDTIMHIVNDSVPFGGVGNSGMGAYHGKRSFDAFTHEKALLISSTGIDLPFRYMPYKGFGMVRKLLK